MIGAVMLGLGRALEETIAVSIILSTVLQGQLRYPAARRIHHLRS